MRAIGNYTNILRKLCPPNGQEGGETMIKIAAFVGKVSELRKALAEHRRWLEKEKEPFQRGLEGPNNK